MGKRPPSAEARGLIKIPKHKWREREQKGTRGRPAFLEDESFRRRILVVASRTSRYGTAKLMGIGPNTLYNWLSRGEAHPDEEPYGSFAREYAMAEQTMEAVGVTIVDNELRRIEKKSRLHELEADERNWTLKVLAQKYPAQYGASESSGRQPHKDPDADEYLQQNQLTEYQLDQMLREPPEEIQQALVRCADDVYSLLLASGWEPPRKK